MEWNKQRNFKKKKKKGDTLEEMLRERERQKPLEYEQSLRIEVWSKKISS